MSFSESSTNYIELARVFAESGQAEKALQAYALVLKQANSAAADRMEAACALLQYGEDYTVAYDAFLALHKDNSFRSDAFSILTDAFYLPNEEQMKQQYEANCALLAEYPYLFREDFLPFEELPIRFYPYDDNGVIPYHIHEDRFEAYTDVNEQVIGHYFFRDLSKPVLAENIFSQYELEYLRDNVRRSDWVARENHIYLHYTDWSVFCAYLQILDIAPLLEEEKIVFLIGDEISQYPIDFKARFGIDYNRFAVKPFGIREINKVIWHTQLNAHNGGDFFNQILHGHPNLIVNFSIMLENTMKIYAQILDCASFISQKMKEGQWSDEQWSDDTFRLLNQSVLMELVALQNPSIKDAMVAYHLGREKYTQYLDTASRIVPAIVYQPHFGTISSFWSPHASGRIVAHCSAYEEVRDSGLLQQFKYIKTFTPIRRATTSYAATVRYMLRQAEELRSAGDLASAEDAPLPVLGDPYFDRIANRSFLIDPAERLVKDSRIVRFEDGKLNPNATFCALAGFLDVPYAESMTYCSNGGGRDPLYEGVRVGLDPAPVYRTYDGYADKSERRLLEYLLRDFYECYGYSFHYYDGNPMTQEEIEALLDDCRTHPELVRRSWHDAKDQVILKYNLTSDETNEKLEELSEAAVRDHKAARLLAIRVLRYGMNFCNADGVPLQMMQMLQLDPALLEQPLYH